VQALGVYQGALDSKEFYVRNFLSLREADKGYDTSKLSVVLSALLQTAGTIARSHQARIEY
jgi:hypothetical protein